MTADDLIKLFRELGFPAGVAIFVLWRVEARLKELTTAVNTLALCVARARPGGPTTP
jgi:hypothetical protein